MRKKSNKLSIKSKEFLLLLLDKQLEKYGITWMEAEDQHKAGILKEPPYKHFKYKSKQEKDEWKEFCINQIQNCKEQLSKKQAELEFAWLDVNLGLSQDCDEN